MKCYMYIRSCLWTIGFFSLAGTVPWIDPSLEALDEINDAEIYRAVVTSMNEWQKKRDLKRSTNRTKREDTNVCYTELGCFDASGPFGYLDMLPSKPEEINTKFLLYPAKNRRRRSGSAHAEVPFEKINDAFEWAKSGFNASLPTKVLIHGFGSDCSYIWAYEIRSALMAVEEVNTICVDWTKGAELPNYVKASANTRLVGKQLSLLLRGLADKNGLKLETTHLIGFSLGAHIAGFAGADLGNLSRITGLDPAGPLFESQDPRARLDQNDAHFVDVIHSNGENLILGGLGSSQPMGHVDFYPNGGRMQKGCSHLFVGAVSDIIWSSAVEGRSLCNHRRAYKFFIDSVSPRCHFPAFPCDSHDDFLEGKCFPCTQERKCGNMGYYADKSKGRGQLYLITRDEEPFCAHQYLVKLETDPGPIPIKSYGKVQITLIGDSFLNETFMMTKKEDEELNLGQPISRIIVPHPILSQPIKIQILYTAYSGWLSSGLSQWKIDKISLMNSFGETSSICKKNLILESGVPLSIPLYPGECEPPKDKPKINLQDRADLMPNFTVKEPFTPTQVIRDGINDKDISSKETNEIPLKNEKENNVDSDAESSRAFNTRIIKADLTNKHLADSDGLIREVVEPILKPHSHIVKNSRSHNHKKEKPEISEPILGPTTSKTAAVQKVADEEKDEIIKYESTNWQVPPVVPEKWNREDESKSLRGFETTTRRNDPIEAIVTTVQFLPQRLARMFEQAEKYARDTLLPFVSTYTPRFLNDIIRPRDPPKYVPLHFEENVLKRQEKKTNFDKSEINFNKKEESENELRVSETRNFKQQDFAPPTKEPLIDEFVETTSYSHIQRITKKPSPEKVEYVFAERLINPEPTSTTQKPSSPSTTTEQKPISSTKVVEATTQSTTFTSSSTVTSVSETLSTSTQKQENPKIGKQKSYNIFVDWGTNKTLDNNQETNKRHNTSIELVPKTISDNIRSNNDEFRPIEAIVNAFNVLPSGLASLFNRAEKYARKNIWPLVDSYVDEFLKDRQQTPSTTPYPTLTENIMLIRDPILFEETSTKTTSFKNAIEEESSVIMKVKPKTTDSSMTDIRYKAVTHFPVNVNRLSISKEKTSEMTSSEQITPKIVVTTKSNQNNDFQNNRPTEFSNNRNITWLTLKIPKSDVKSKSRNITFNTAINTSYTSSNSLDNFSTIFYEKTANTFKHHDLPSKTSIETFTEASLAVTNPITIDSSTLEVELLSPKIDRVFVEDTTDILSTSTDTEGKLSTITKAKFTNIDSILNISKMNNTNTSASPSITELSSTTLITNMIKSNSNNTESGVVQSDLEYFLDTNNSTVNSFLPSFSGTVRNTKGINVEQSINPKTKISATPNENIHNLTVIYSLSTETQSTKSNNINDSVHSTTKILIQPDIEVAKHNLSNKTMKYNYNITNYSAASTIENFNHSTTEVYGTTAELVIITNSSIKGQYNTNNLTALKNISVDNIQNSTPYIESAKMQRISELMVSATSKKAGGSEEISSTTTGTNTISASELPLSTTRATRPSSTTTMIPPLKVTKSFIKKSYVHVQRIPKKGEKVQYKMPKWSDIRIDPALLESTTLQTLSISTTTKITTSTVKRPFVSYIQKIPKKGKKIYYDIPKFILVDGEVDKNVLRKRQIT